MENKKEKGSLNRKDKKEPQSKDDESLCLWHKGGWPCGITEPNPTITIWP